jgi:hypothetical protein
MSDLNVFSLLRRKDGRGDERNNLILQTAEEQDRSVGDFRQEILVRPVLVTESSDILARWENTKEKSY